MPLYEYQCDKCGDVFEVVQKFSDDPLSIHEKCGGHVHRLLSAPALQFKGSGWYITDYAKSGSGSSEKSNKKDDSAAKTSSKESSSTPASSSTSSETKSTS